MDIPLRILEELEVLRGRMSMEQKNEIVLFETKDKEVVLSVPMDGDAVWLTQAQMAELFDTTKQNVSLHANNCFKEGELDKKSVVKDFLTTASDGKNYKTKSLLNQQVNAKKSLAKPRTFLYKQLSIIFCRQTFQHILQLVLKQQEVLFPFLEPMIEP